MACGRSGRPESALAKFARSLKDRTDEGAVDVEFAPFLFPMYTVPAEVLLQMTEVETHEDLKAAGVLVEFDASMGNAIFVSHQWVGSKHPDPESKQLRVLQDALMHMLSNLHHIPVDAFTEVHVPRTRPLQTADLKAAPLFIWYDYFSCPQLESCISLNTFDRQEGSQLSRAIGSIPAYVARCRFFFALCPVIESLSLEKVFTSFTWSERGWCRVERVLRELSKDQSWVMIKSSTSVELVSSILSGVGGSAGEGQYTKAEDREKLAVVLQNALLRKLRFLLQAQDLESYRVLLNMQGFYLRGLPASPIRDLVPGFEPDETTGADKATQMAHQFLYQNGFATVNEFDRSGWAPVHYAALLGNTAVLKGLLKQKANINRWTRKDQPQSGLPIGAQPLQICILFKHHSAMRFLLSARANLDSNFYPDVTVAAMANDPEAVRIICQAGGSLFKRNVVGMNSFDIAGMFGSLAALEELVVQVGPDLRKEDLSKALLAATGVRGGSAEMVQRLLELRTDPNVLATMSSNAAAHVLFSAKSIQHRYSKPTFVTRWAYHLNGQTALMAAVMSGQYEAAAALVAAGAKLGSRNSRNWTAADFAKGQAVPDFLTEAFDGQLEGCQRVASQAIKNASFEV